MDMNFKMYILVYGKVNVLDAMSHLFYVLFNVHVL